MQKLIIIVISLFFLCSFNSIGQQNDGLQGEDDPGSFAIQMASAWVKLSSDDFYGALRIYKSLYDSYKENAQLNFRMGECYLKVKEMDKAMTHLEKASKVDTLVNRDLFLLLGQAYHYEGRIDDAIEAFYSHKTRLNNRSVKLTESEKQYVNTLLRQCLTAKELMAKPVNVEITNLGANINSKHTDANPSITADGKTLIFTSRRPETTGGKIDPAVEEFYDDIYISKWNDDKWGECVQLKHPINTDAHDANLSITPDGKYILLYKNMKRKTSSGDIYISEIKPDGNWSEPQPFADKYINSTYFESSACLSADGSSLFFVSERTKDGFGSGDIYLAKKLGDTWGKPVNLGSIVNSIDDEIGVYIHPDGKTLFFSSKGHNTMGGYDIFMTVNEDGRWSEPVNMGYPINTTKDEIHFVFTTDRKTAYVSSSREGTLGKTDLFSVDMTNYLENNTHVDNTVVSSITGPELSIIKGSIVDQDGKPLKTLIEIIDSSTKESSNLESNEKGEYFTTLPAGRKYEIRVKAKGYKPMAVKFKLPLGENETYTMTKHLILNAK